jgi:hypothetical protein
MIRLCPGLRLSAMTLLSVLFIPGCWCGDNLILSSAAPFAIASNKFSRPPEIVFGTEAEMVESVLAILPVGSAVRDAAKKMKAKGFECSLKENEWTGETFDGPCLCCEGYYPTEDPFLGTSVRFCLEYDQSGTITRIWVKKIVACL